MHRMSFVLAKDKRTLLFSENGDMVSVNQKKKKETYSMVWKFCLAYA
jgi:hypothetical protein